MFKRLRILAPLVLLVAALVAPTPTLAYYTGNLAGRPMDGSALSSCHGTAYGRFSGALVLFTAYHCRPSAAGGEAVFGPTDTVIGHWTTQHIAGGGGASSNYFANDDLTFILLDTGNWPSVKNQVYHGSSGSYTITRNPPAAIDCGDYPIGGSIYQAFQTSSTSTLTPGQSITESWWTGGASQCEVSTQLVSHATTYKDSGSPMVLGGYSNTVFALATARNVPANHLIVTPLYEGINAFNSLSLSEGGSGAWLCQTASC